MFSWKRGLLHVALPALVVLGAGLALASTGALGSPEQTGERVGEALGFVVPIALAISYLAQCGRTRLAWALGIGAPVVLAIAALAAIARGVPVPALTAAERAPLERVTVAGSARLHQAAIGFWLPDPGAAFAPLDLSTQPGLVGLDREHAEMWAYRDPASASAVIVAVAKGEGATETSFRSFIAALLDGVVHGSAGTLARTDVHWTHGGGTATAELALHGGPFTLTARTLRAAAGMPFVVTVMVVGPVPPTVRPLLAGATADEIPAT